MADKSTLRRVYLEKRRFLSDEEFLRRNQLLQHQIKETVDFHSYSLVHIFLSIEKNNEVLTRPIIDLIKAQNHLTKLAISKTLPNGTLKHYYLNSSTQLEMNRWGIPEPVNGEEVDVEQINLVFIPLIAFDKQGHRIGYGKGYYDRFLEKIPTVKKIGLSLSSPLDHIPYSQSTDVKMDYCITPFKVFRF